MSKNDYFQSLGGVVLDERPQKSVFSDKNLRKLHVIFLIFSQRPKVRSIIILTMENNEKNDVPFAMCKRSPSAMHSTVPRLIDYDAEFVADKDLIPLRI